MFGANAFGWVYPAEIFPPTILPVATADSASASESVKVGIPASDVNGATTEATGNLIISAIDQGAVTEAVAIKVVLSATDVNGATTEDSASPLATSLVSADTGSSAELISLAAKPSVSDAGTATIELVAPNVGVSDSSVISELAAIRFVDVDSNSFSDVATISGVGLTNADVNSITTELVGLSVQAVGVDTSSANETVTYNYALVSPPDQGIGSEIAAAVSLTRITTDQNWGIDEYPVIRAQIPIFDVISGATESLSLSAALSGGDSAAGSDSAARNVSQSVTDTFLGADVASSTAQMASTDAASGFDVAGLAQNVLLALDQGTATSELARTGRITADVGSSTQNQALKVKFTVTDSATGLDYVTAYRHGAHGDIRWILDATVITPVLLSASADVYG